ncbi:DNA mismatch repair protein Mlh1 [Vanrija albida]|uniref:DNA mismatch repair protein Mlh1 n=1 Tax=Vanrija albida TaxID=181172 RepID=A0ABR3Q2T7_9TREE
MDVDDVGVDVSVDPDTPKPIRKLSADVVNQIAAAEIIHRPANAIKELLENSLDAGSTSIKVTVKDGGLKLLQITDNGHGINKADLALLCERYATSKIAAFSDLQSLATYGFRGEALASISYCSHLEVITKTHADSVGWKAQYANGVLKEDARPTAANDGTVITASDLFYNNALRKRAFRSASDEYARILDVVTKYAVHNPHVAWVCKKAGSALPDVSTNAGSSAKANIAQIYTPTLAAELLEVPETTFAPKLGASARGWVSNANHNGGRKAGFLLFINNRLVDSSKIKKAIDALYTTYLPKGASPFAYLSLSIDPDKVDVNVHPTKSEVHFLHEDEIVDALVAAVEKALAGANVSRTFSVQTLLPGAPDASQAAQKPRTTAPNYKVRMDPSNRTLDSMITVIDPSQIADYDERPSKRRGADASGEVTVIEDEDETPMWSASVQEAKESSSKDIPESVCDFSSIQELRRAVQKKGNEDLNDTLGKHAFVGIADRHQCLGLIQHSTRLFLVDYAALGDEHFYQLGLRQFGALGRLRLEPAPDIKDLLRLAAEDEPGIEENGLTVDTVVKRATSLLVSKRDMIDEYFSLSITSTGTLDALPLLLKGYTPNLDRLPHFLLCLATRVDWEDEKACFEGVLRELAFFYSPRPFVDDAADDDATADEVSHHVWQLEHVLFPSFRRHTQWPKSLSDRHVNQVANLPDLFRVFERC